ncbi:polysaccharide biosynthesis/export family protein [Microcoleus sp. F10-B2]|uniref:polysaccharide biosynthesis/export family protein n=1 Tax=Microcoleus sp. F10-B2 TaxID=2818751 RepID=UPI002FD38CF9
MSNIIDKESSMLTTFRLAHIFTGLSLIILVMPLASCANRSSLVQGGAVGVVNPGELPAPSDQDVKVPVRAYRIGPFDKLRISVFGIEELNEKQIETDASGRISYPLVGAIDAAGLTPGELATAIEDKLRVSYIRDPQVTVNLEETVSQVVTLDGQVDKPGVYPVVGRMTLMRALARAGGASEFAKLDDVIIFRTVDGQSLAGVYNMRSIRSGVYADPEVYANDIIVVGDSPRRRLIADLLQVLPAIATPLVVLLQN